ncbi:hypothetical protein DFP73DRAFT_553761 [Morchella snyderi]|nr:hypothetical protein DFP73DRAFT_553761 [Morchella snyderi]
MSGGSLGPLMLAVMFTLLPLSTVFMALRFYCRSVIVKNVGSDDWIMLVAFIMAWGMGVTNYFHVYYGTGKHTVDLDYANIIIPTLKLWYVYQIQYLLVLFFLKASILSFYRRLSPARGYQIVIYIVSGVIVTYTFAMFFVNVFECPKDPSRAWAPTFPQGCNDLVVVYYVMASFNILSDIVILLLPLPSLMKLQVNKRKRVALLLIFSCGSVAVVASIVRINALYKYQTAVLTGGDIPYIAIYILLWSQIEVNVGIISASAPALKPLVRSILGGTTFAESSYAQGGELGYSGNPSSRHGIPLRSLNGSVAQGVTTEIQGRERNESEENIVMKNDEMIRTVEVKINLEREGSTDSIRQLEFGR